MNEQQVMISGFDLTQLAGSLTLTAGAETRAVVLFIHGSGPLDRDSNVSSFKLNIFNTLATAFSKEGIASLRFDKRGCGKSQGNYHTAGHSDLVNDAASALDFLFSNFPDKPVYLLGHSEGTLIAAELSLQYPNLAGIILLCPFIQSMEQVLLNQAEHLATEIKKMKGIQGFILRLMPDSIKDQKKAIQKVKNSHKDVIRVQGKRMPAKWLRELLEIDIEQVYAQVVCPTYLLIAEKDIQCDPDDGRLIQEKIKGSVKSVTIKDLTHILRKDTEEASLFRYQKIYKQPVDAEVMETCIGFIRQPGAS